MKRLFWVAVGATVGSVLVRRLSTRAAKLVPKHLTAMARHRADAIRADTQAFVQEVRDGAEQRENELAEALATIHDGSQAPAHVLTEVDPEISHRATRGTDPTLGYGFGRSSSPSRADRGRLN